MARNGFVEMGFFQMEMEIGLRVEHRFGRRSQEAAAEMREERGETKGRGERGWRKWERGERLEKINNKQRLDDIFLTGWKATVVLPLWRAYTEAVGAPFVQFGSPHF